MRRRAPEGEGEEVNAACVLGQRAGQMFRRAAGLGAGREGSGLLCRGLTLLGTLNHLPGAAFPKLEWGACDRACLLLRDFRFYIK